MDACSLKSLRWCEKCIPTAAQAEHYLSWQFSVARLLSNGHKATAPAAKLCLLICPDIWASGLCCACMCPLLGVYATRTGSISIKKKRLGARFIEVENSFKASRSSKLVERSAVSQSTAGEIKHGLRLAPRAVQRMERPGFR